MNFVRDIVDRAPPEAPALTELTRVGDRRVWTFDEISAASARFAGHLQRQGLRKGDIVLVWLGNRAEWVLALLAGFRLGIVVATCPEQLRARDLHLRIEAVSPAAVIADQRNRDELLRAAPSCPVIWIPDDALWKSGPRQTGVDLDPTDPCLVTFTSGTSGEPKPVLHLQRYLTGQRLQAKHWMGVEEGDIVWCTASSGWSKSARNAFIAPWLRGATVLLHDARFDPDERVSIIASERVGTLCMAPTEYRFIAKRAGIPRFPALSRCVAAGEPLDPGVISEWAGATGIEIRDGYGQTETGQLTGFWPGERVRPGSMGKPLPGIRLWVEDGQLVVDPRTVPTFFGGYLRQTKEVRADIWNTGDRVDVDTDGYLWFRGRADDIIISAGYRIGPVEVESALTDHPAVQEAAAVAAPDGERGAVVRAVVVLRDGFAPSEALKRTLQEHVKAQTAPYKYPRVVDFVAHLPKTPSGKIKRAALRATSPP